MATDIGKTLIAFLGNLGIGYGKYRQFEAEKEMEAQRAKQQTSPYIQTMMEIAQNAQNPPEARADAMNKLSKIEQPNQPPQYTPQMFETPEAGPAAKATEMAFKHPEAASKMYSQITGEPLPKDPYQEAQINKLQAETSLIKQREISERAEREYQELVRKAQISKTGNRIPDNIRVWAEQLRLQYGQELKSLQLLLIIFIDLEILKQKHHSILKNQDI